MALRISSQDVHRVLDAVTILHGCDDVAQLPSAMRDAVGSLVKGDVVAYSELDLTELAKTPPAQQDLDALARLFDDAPLVTTNNQQVNRKVNEVMPWLVRFAEEHPLLRLALFDPNPPVAKVSDFLTLPQFRGLGLYRQFFGPLSLTRQIAVCPTNCDGIVTGLTVNRSGRDFTERDRNCLTLLSPHLREAFRATTLRAHLLDSLDQQHRAIQDVPTAILSLTADHRKIQFETSVAREILQRCFPESNGVMPEPLDRWLSEMLHRSGTISHPRAVNQSLTLRTPAGVLGVRYVQVSSRVYLLLNLRDDEQAARRLAELGLTMREAEILNCLRDGGSNRQIAARLHISPGTVRTHVERILSKLGVPTRTAAVRLAEELLSQA